MNGWGWNAPAESVWLWVPVAVLLLYLFRPRHRPQPVAAAFLWRLVGDRLGGQSLWRRLQNQRLLWLQLLFCLVTIAALMRPFQVRPGLVSRQVVLLVDTSASMAAAQGNGESRLLSGLREARKMVAQAPAGTEFLLATLDRDLLIVQPFTQDRATLQAQLGGLLPRALRGQDERVTPFVISLLKTNPQAQVHWFSDHPLPGISNIAHLADQGRINYAIESFQSSPEALFLALKNYHQQAAQLRVRVTGSGGFKVDRVCTLRGQGRQLLHLPLPASGQGPYQAQLLSEDDFALDNQACCLEADRKATRLLSHAPVPPFLEQAAQAASGASLVQVEGETAVAGIHLWDTLPEVPPAGLQIAARAPDSWVESQPVEDEGALLLTQETQQAWKFRVSSQRWGARQRLKAGLTGVTPLLVNAQGEPLLVQRGQALVWLFRLEDSDLPLSPELPVLLSGWLRTQADPSQSLQTGLLCDNRIQLPGPGPLTLQGPRTTEVIQGKSKLLEWSPGWPGLYKYKGSGQAERVLAVNFHAPEESDLGQPVKVALPNPPSSEVLQTRPMSQEYTNTLVGLALLILLWEYRLWWGDKPRC
ncbi:VWA domain-containing protein [bacterium]|nr:VWA domain-containing protein [bacterium]